MKARREFMVMHKLGPQMATPMRFDTEADAREHIENDTKLMHELGMEPGMVLHTRYVTEWEQEQGR